MDSGSELREVVEPMHGGGVGNSRGEAPIESRLGILVEEGGGQLRRGLAVQDAGTGGRRVRAVEVAREGAAGGVHRPVPGRVVPKADPEHAEPPVVLQELRVLQRPLQLLVARQQVQGAQALRAEVPVEHALGEAQGPARVPASQQACMCVHE
jgi:hypothetical protein